MPLPLNGRSHDVLTHITIPDRPFLGRTTKELCLIVGGVAGGLGALGQRGAPPPLMLAEGLTIFAACVTLAVYRPHSRSLLSWGRLAALHASSPRLLAWHPSAPVGAAPPTRGAAPPYLAALGALPAATPPTVGAATVGARPAKTTVAAPAGAVRPRRGTRDAPFVPRSIEDGVVTFADGSRCAVLACSGRNSSLMDPAGRQSLHAGFHGFLMGLSGPIKFLTSAMPADTRAYAAIRTARLKRLPPGLRRLESADTAYMSRVVKRRNMLDHRTYVVVPLAGTVPAGHAGMPRGPLDRVGRGQAGEAASAPLSERDRGLLTEQCDRVTADLVPAGVDAWRLDTDALARAWHTLLNPRSALLQPLPTFPLSPPAHAEISFQSSDEDHR